MGGPVSGLVVTANRGAGEPSGWVTTELGGEAFLLTKITLQQPTELRQTQYRTTE